MANPSILPLGGRSVVLEGPGMIRKLSLLCAGALMGASAMGVVYGAVGTTANAAGSETYRQLAIFGDIFERVRANYVTPPEEKALVESFCQNAKDVTAEYSATTRWIDQLVFIAPLFRMSENQTKAGGKSYTYFFTPESSWPLLKSGHAVDLSTVFNHPEERLVTGRIFNETFSRTLRKMWVQFAKTGNPSLSADQSPDGKAKEWPLYDLENKQLMIFDEFNIHPEKESQRKILDWDRTYFLTKYYCL
jgi:para-nitrobenzyl esterase